MTWPIMYVLCVGQVCSFYPTDLNVCQKAAVTWARKHHEEAHCERDELWDQMLKADE